MSGAVMILRHVEHSSSEPRRPRKSRTQTKLGVCILLFCLTLLPVLSSAKNDFPTNVELAGTAVDDAADRVVERFHLETDSVIAFNAGGESDVERFATGRLAARLSEKHRLISHSTDGSPDLTVTVVRADVRYNNPKRKRFWNHATLARKAEIELLCRVKNPSGLILAETITASREDRLPVSELERLEQGGLVFGIPDRPQSGWMTRLLEPLLAVAVTGTVIYLFFHIRSE
jgi:hypothetical protein